MSQQNNISVLDAALEEARRRGLPTDWTVKLNTQNRKRWISPKGRVFSSLPKVFDSIGVLPLPTTIPNDGEPSATGTGAGKKKPTKKRPVKSEKPRKGSGTGCKKPRLESLKPSKYPITPIIADILVEPEPEVDPETALDLPHEKKGKKTPDVAIIAVGGAVTVHWDPDSLEGRRVGYRIRVFDQKEEEWRESRVLRYDPGSNKHKIQYDDNDDVSWLRLKHEIIQCGGRFVWALVKGFAWWPAQIFNSEGFEPATETTNKEGHVFVKFFGADQVAMVKDTSDFIRPFNSGKIDSVIAKSKKKRNMKAIAEAQLELKKTEIVRQEAARFYATKAFAFANRRADNFLGKRVQFFRSDINYPQGDTVVGTVKQYSSTAKKWLISYEASKHNFGPSWINFQAKECRIKLLDTAGPKENLSTDDLAAFLFDKSRNAIVAKDTSGCGQTCVQCSEKLNGSFDGIVCGGCKSTYHPGCCDPPLTNRAVEKILLDKNGWRCPKCVKCMGCNQFDIAFGVRPYPKPPTLFKTGSSIPLCSACTPMYNSDRYCPDCGHCWDDSKYQKVQHLLRWQKKQKKEERNKKKEKNRKRKRSASDSDSDQDSDEEAVDYLNPEDLSEQNAGEANKEGGCNTIDPSWYNPDSTVWGFNEGAMLICDNCNLWVHAGCAGLSKREYEETNKGEHPIHSKEFLCRTCCINRCCSLVSALAKQDKLSLFAVPVTEEMAPTYHDVIKNPIDLETMMARAKEGTYHNYAWVRESFELMVMNALIFNRPTSKYHQEGKRYYKACMSTVFKILGKAAPPGKYADALTDAFQKEKRWKEAEKERVKQDETAEKKDLVAGAEVAVVKLSPLATPIDTPSCVPSTVVRIKPVDAFFCSWQDACFSCGSSGAADTMLFCVDCGEAYHSFCANVPIHSMTPSAVSNWRCANCKVCEITGAVPEDETMLLYCEMCDRACDLTKLDPPLEAVPSGLFICGSCIDCKSCGTSSEKKMSVKYWSRDPQRCYRCGGCEGLMSEINKAMQCTVCSKYWRKGDNDLIPCKTCNRTVHIGCDNNAELVLKRAGGDKSIATKTYECPRCLDRKDGSARALELQLHFEKQAQLIVRQNCAVVPRADQYPAIEGLQWRLAQESSWQVRRMWKSEYLSLISDAKRMYTVAAKKLGPDLFGLFSACRQNPSIPPWMIMRAHRWVHHHRKREKKDPSNADICAVVLHARMSAAFLSIALWFMDQKSRKKFRLKQPDRLRLLLVPRLPGLLGTVAISPDPIKETKDLDIITADHLSTETYAPILDGCPPKATAKVDQEPKRSSVELLSGDGKSEQNAKIDFHPAARPLNGWDDDRYQASGRPKWRDPRRCAMCNLCGDDDAGRFKADNTCAVVPSSQALLNKSANIERQSSDTADNVDGSGNRISKHSIPGPDLIAAGRLIPIGGGLWAHTACALWSSEVYESPVNGTIHAIEKARSRGAQLKCFGCGRNGATVGCQKSNCSFNYHFACAHACGAVFTANQQMLCKKHKNGANQLEADFCIEHMRPLRSSNEGLTEASDSSLCHRVGNLVVHSLGRVEQEIDGFHSENYITPPGYVATRIFWSFQTVKKRTVYVLRVLRKGSDPLFAIDASDAPDLPIRSKSMVDAYEALMDRVRHCNSETFARGDHFTQLPMERLKETKAYGLNAPQFFGFGLITIRRALEACPDTAAVAAPLLPTSPAYQFCYIHPNEDDIKTLQRKRAALSAEKALKNTSGCARTEGMKAVAKSGGSGRITRALVRRADEEDPAAEGASSGNKERNKEQPKISDNHQRKYQELKTIPLEDRLEAQRSHIHGWGLFTKNDIPKHEMIIEYMGEVLRHRVADKREKFYEESGVGSCYMFRLDLQRIVDATKVGCMARFMNHSCQNNAYAKVVNVKEAIVGLEKEQKLIIFANRDIKAGEEITYDYKFPVEDGSLKCTCGAVNCIGRLN